MTGDMVSEFIKIAFAKSAEKRNFTVIGMQKT
jgi:hypothetical protein